MKQYGDVITNYTCGPSMFDDRRRYEAVLEGAYNKQSRQVRRFINGSAEKWWRRQVENDGMPYLYHCWGW